MPTKSVPAFDAFFSLLGAASLLCLLAGPNELRAQGVNISSFSIAGNGTRQLGFSGDATNYYVLYRGTTLANLATPLQVVLGASPITAMQDLSAQPSAAFYRVRTIATNAPVDLDGDGVDDVAELRTGTNPLWPNAPAASLVINEVDYDQIGTDTAEFVEILNVSANPLSLVGLRLVFINGTDNMQYQSVDLSPAGMLEAGQYLVVKSATVFAPPDALTLQFSAASDNVQNGAPDGLAIFDSAFNQIVDALSYEGAITAATITGFPGAWNLVEGTVLAGTVTDSNAVFGSLARLPNGQDTNDANTDWKFSTTPTPGEANVP